MGNAQPFLKWAGGKVRLAQQIAAHMPLKGGIYFEPFLGGGSVYFAVAPSCAVLSDENPALIGAYRSIRRAPEKVHEALLRLATNHSDAHYYQTRQAFNHDPGSEIEQAARFIYLNKSGFNGIFRVNQLGHYNVPSGQRKQIAIPTVMQLRGVAVAMEHAMLVCSDFELVLGLATRKDTVYLDPPYPPLSRSAYFTHYTAGRFAETDQERVADVAHTLKARGCNIVVSNADTPLVRRLYKGWVTVEIEVRRWVGALAEKNHVKELLLIAGGK